MKTWKQWVHSMSPTSFTRERFTKEEVWVFLYTVSNEDIYGLMAVCKWGVTGSAIEQEQELLKSIRNAEKLTHGKLSWLFWSCLYSGLFGYVLFFNESVNKRISIR